MSNHSTDNERAMNILANYTGRNLRLQALDTALQNGHTLTATECQEVFMLIRWTNMDKGN